MRSGRSQDEFRPDHEDKRWKQRINERPGPTHECAPASPGQTIARLACALSSRARCNIREPPSTLDIWNTRVCYAYHTRIPVAIPHRMSQLCKSSFPRLRSMRGRPTLLCLTLAVCAVGTACRSGSERQAAEQFVDCWRFVYNSHDRYGFTNLYASEGPHAVPGMLYFVPSRQELRSALDRMSTAKDLRSTRA